MSTTIYFFSGTGNSLKIAKDLNSRLDSSKLIQITSKNQSITKDMSSDKIGIVFPVYFNGLPAMVRSFLENLQISKNAYIFAVANFGGSAGISFSQIDDILKKKGSSLSASFKVSMPGNYQVMYSPFSQEKQTKLFKNANEEIVKIATCVKKNDIVRSHDKDSGIKKALGTLLHNSVSAKTKDKDKNFWTTEKCNGCSTCSKVCPANNIEMINEKPQWKHNCEMCVACMQWCPQKSIQYKKNTIKRGRYHHPEIKITELFQNR